MRLSRIRLYLKYWPDFSLLLSIAALQVLFLVLYYSREQFVYYFDLVGFERVVNDLAPLFPGNWQRLLEYLETSLATDYNYYYTVPLLPVVHYLGPSRGHYLLGVILLYQIPFTLALGLLFSRLAEKRARLFFWVAVIIAALIPNTWSPSLRGYPDVGGALFLCLALGLYLHKDPDQRWWQYLLSGFCLAWAAIFRRYNLYADIAFFLVAGSLLVIEWIQYKKFPVMLKKGLWLASAAVSFLLTLYVFNRPFLENILTTNYYALYSSYLREAQSLMDFFISEYGWLIWLSALLGYGVGFRFKQANRKALFFVFLWGLLILLSWVFYVRQSGLHYTFSITIFITVGIASLCEYLGSLGIGKEFAEGGPAPTRQTPQASPATQDLLKQPGKLAGRVGLGLLALFLIVNFFLTFTFVQFPPAANAIRPYFSKPVPPLFREDYAEVLRLVDSMRELTPNRENIYVVDSSAVMNYDLLQRADQQLYQQDARLNLLVPPQIDSRDSYPLESLLLTDFVIVSSPLQTHLEGDNQRVVRYVYDAFQNQWDFTKDFVELPIQFRLGRGDLVTRVYQRIRPTDIATALAMLQQMEDYLPQRPGSQQDWILLTKLYSRGQASQYSFLLEPKFLAAESAVQFLYITDLPAQGTLVIELKELDEGMPALVFDLLAYDTQQKKSIPVGQAVWNNSDAAVISIPFSIDDQIDKQQSYLVLQVARQNGETRELPGSFFIEFSPNVK